MFIDILKTSIMISIYYKFLGKKFKINFISNYNYYDYDFNYVFRRSLNFKKILIVSKTCYTHH